jgi:hypothetical protein
MNFEHEPHHSPADTVSSGVLHEENNIFEVNQTITPYRLMEANQSIEAEHLRQEFDYNRSQSVMTLDWECPDARNWRIMGTESFYFHTIANGGDVKLVRSAANSKVTRRIAIIAHILCGGITAKKKQVSEGIYTPESDDLNGYVSGAIYHPSELQAGIQARALAEMTEKEVGALVRNHEDGTLKVLAVFNRTDGGDESHLPDNIYTNPDPELLYEIPYLKTGENPGESSELPEEWDAYLTRYNENRKKVLENDPAILERVKVHNPNAFALKTDLRAGEIWLPGIAKPGTIFRMTSPRDRIKPSNGETKTILNPHDIRLVWRQAEYIVSHATENREIPDAPFRDTDTFIIATPEYAISQRIALDFAQQPFSSEWLTDERNKVLVAQNNAGHIRRVGEMKFSLKDGLVTGFEERDAIAA